MSSLFANRFLGNLRGDRKMCDARKRAAWKGWREEYPELNDQDIVDALVERFNLSEATRYRLYNEARLFRRKKFSKTEKGEMRIHIL